MMTLRRKMFLWLLPIIIAILLFAYGFYSARERIVVDHIYQTTLLASSVGEQEINHFLQMRNSEFNLLNKSINQCVNSPFTHEFLATTALRYVTGFSALVMSDPLGKVVHVELSSNQSNRHVLRKDTLSQAFLPASDFIELQHRYAQWSDRLAGLKQQELAAFNKVSLLKMRGETSSTQFRDLQDELFSLREEIDSPPTLVSLTGGEQAEAIGLPYTEDTFLFSKPMLDCNGGLKGFYTAYLDRTLLEDSLYEIKQQMAMNDLQHVDVALVRKSTNRLISNVRFTQENHISDLIPDGLPVLDEKLGGMYALRTIEESVHLSRFSHDHFKAEAHNEIEKGWLLEQQGISLLVFVSLDEIKERCKAIKLEVLLESLLLLSVFLILISLLSRHIVSPIIRLTSRAELLTKGEHIPEALIERNDEIGKLSQTFEVMANAIKNNEKQLIDLATHDALTGCLNRRALFLAAEEEKKRAARTSVDLCVCMLDLDHFKRINDRFGHKAGDNVLKQFCESFQGLLRTEDKMGRIGGEEFAIVLTGANLQSGLEIAERIRQRILTIKVDEDKQHTFKVSVSIGVSEWKMEESFEQVLSRADDLLYKAKQSGRNRVEG